MIDENLHTEEAEVVIYPSNKKRNYQLLTALFLVIFISLAGWLYYSQLESVPATAVTIEEVELSNVPPSSFEETITSVGQNYVFELQLVPTALDSIEITAPTEETKALDAVDYQQRSAELAQVNSEFAKRDDAFSLAFADGKVFSEFLLSQEKVATLYQLYDELIFLASEFDSRVDSTPLYEQVASVDLLAPINPNPFDGNPQVVFPSQRAVSGFYVAEVMALADPDNAELYHADSQLFAERGILYGQYGISSVNAAKSLVEQYLQLATENNPELLTTLIN